jgi:hypothetical protein
MLRLWREWRAERDREQRAASYVRTLYHEPSDPDATLLAELSGADPDHARWELRYARRAIGLLVAERDALDDRTASLVARALSNAQDRDPHVDPARRELANRQLNERLRAYADALTLRGAADPPLDRIAATMLRFAGCAPSVAKDRDAVRRMSAVLSVYRVHANDALRSAFGAAALPDDLPPSRLARKQG